MNDVFRQIMLTGADENLVTRDGVAAVRNGLGFGAQHAKIGAAVRLGQAHGAGPFTRRNFGQIQRLLLGGAMRMQALVGTVREARIHRPRLIAGIPEFVARLIDHQWQPLAAVFRVAGKCSPSSLNKLLVGRFKARGRGHCMGCDVELATLDVAGLVEREDHFRGELAALLQNRHDGVDVVVSMRRQRSEFGRNIKQLLHHKTHIAKGRGISRHVSLLLQQLKTLQRIVSYDRLNLSFETCTFCRLGASLYVQTTTE